MNSSTNTRDLWSIRDLPVESGSSRPRVESARVSSAGSTRPGQLGLVYIVYEFLFGGSITTLKGYYYNYYYYYYYYCC